MLLLRFLFRQFLWPPCKLIRLPPPKKHKHIHTQVVTLEGEVEENVAAAAEFLVAALPETYVVKVVDDDDLKDV